MHHYRTALGDDSEARPFAAAAAPVFLWLTAAVLSVELVALLARALVYLPGIGDVGYPDSAMVVRVAGLLAHGELFPPLDRAPYLVTVYGPLTYLVLSVPYAAAGPLGLHPLLTLRLAEAGLFFACVALVAGFAYRLSRSWMIALVAVLLAVAGEPLRPWVLQLRGDFLGLLLSLSCIALCMRGTSGRAFRGAAVLAGLAILSKQTFIAAPAAVVIWLAWQREFRLAAVWAAIVAAVVIAGYGIMFAREPDVLRHIAALRAPVFEYRAAVGFLVTAVVHVKTLYGVAGAVILLQSNEPRARLLALYLGLSWLVAAATIPQVGGAMNYFWEPWFVSAALGAIAIGAVARQLTQIPAFLVIALLLLHFRVLSGGALTGYSELSVFAETRAHVERSSRTIRIIGSVVRDFNVLSSLSPVSRLTQPVLPDPFLTSVLVQSNSWDTGPLVGAIRAGEFDMVFGFNAEDSTAYRRLPLWNPLIEEAGRHPYETVCRLIGQSVWLSPSSPPELRTRLAAVGCISDNTSTPR